MIEPASLEWTMHLERILRTEGHQRSIPLAMKQNVLGKVGLDFDVDDTPD